MTNSYYVPSGTPSTGAFAASAAMRTEFDSIASGFNLLPPLSAGAASRAVVAASNGLSLITTTGTLALAGNFATSGAFSTTLVAGANVSVTLPIVSGLTLATLTGTETLTNKTVSGSSVWNAGAVTSSSTVTAAATSGFYLGANVALAQASNYTVVYASDGRLAIRAGNAADPNNYFSAASYQFNNAAVTLTYATIDSSGLDLHSGLAYRINGATVLSATALGSGLSATNLTLTTPALGTPTSGNLTNCSGFPGSASGTGTTFLGGDVALSNTGSYFDGPNTGSIGASGQVWEITIVGLVTDTAGAAVLEVLLFNGTSYILDSTVVTGGANEVQSVTATRIVTLSGATTFTLRARDGSSTSGKLLASGSASQTGNLATSITAKRLA